MANRFGAFPDSAARRLNGSRSPVGGFVGDFCCAVGCVLCRYLGGMACLFGSFIYSLSNILCEASSGE